MLLFVSIIEAFCVGPLVAASQMLVTTPPLPPVIGKDGWRSAGYATPNPHPGKHPICHDARLLGIWRRAGVDQQLVITENGEAFETYDGPGMLPDSAEGGGENDLLADGSRICQNDPLNVFGDSGYLGTAVIDRDGLGMTVLTKNPRHPRIRYRRVVPLPTIDWKKTTPGGGYTWDFGHACPPSVPRHVPMDDLVDDWHFFWFGQNGVLVRPDQQAFAADSDGTLWWSFSPSDPLTKRDYCAPDKYTLIVAQPGPRGVLLPHRYDVFSHGGQISLNGQRAAMDPRANLGRGSHVNPPVLLGRERPAHAPNE